MALDGGLGRRRFLGIAGAALAGGIAMPAEAARRLLAPRTLAFQNLHTGEKLNTVYFADGRYLPDAMRHIDWLLRDFRTDEVHPIDPRLLDLLAALRRRLRLRTPIEVISAYRSPVTNALLASFSEGVATNSLHMQGRAIDVRLPGRPLWAVRRAALALRAGGVGYYPRSQFVHLDVGAVRHW